MEQHGWMLIKIRKCLNIYLWSLDRSELEESMEPGMQIVPLYESDDRQYLKINNKMVRIN